MKKPAVVWVAQIGLVLAAVSYGSLAAGGIGVLARPDSELARWLPALLIGGIVAGLGIALLLGTQHQQTTRRRLLLFFWSILLLYPLTNVLAAFGYFPLPPRLRPEELAGAAAFELLRYVLLLTLLVWLGFSRKAAAYVSLKRDVPAPTQEAPEIP